MTELRNRSWRARLAFGYMVDAIENFVSCPTGSTLSRFSDSIQNQPNGPTKYQPVPYTRMWNTITRYHDEMEFEGVPLSELSDSEFLSYVQRAPQLGFTYKTSKVEGSRVMAKASAWSKRGWFRYEEKRARQLGFAKRGAILGGFLLLGDFVGVFGAV